MEENSHAEVLLNFMDEVSTVDKKGQEAKERWEAVSRKIEATRDSLGLGIDKKVKDAIVAFNAFGINTSGSCEGHLEWGTGTPWIEFESPNQPAETFENEIRILERIANENGITVEQLQQDEKYEEKWREANREFAKNPKTQKRIEWQELNNKLKVLVEKIVDEYHIGKEGGATPNDLQIKFRYIGGQGRFRIYIGSEDDYNRDFKKMSEEEKIALEKRLQGYQKELEKFTKFLMEKFLTSDIH